MWGDPSPAGSAPWWIALAGILTFLLGAVVVQRTVRGEARKEAMLAHETAARGEAEQGLARRDRELRTMVADVPVGLFRTDAEGRITAVNEEWCALTGRDADDAVGTSWMDVVHPDDRAAVRM